MSDDDVRSDSRSLRAVRDLGLLFFVAAALVAGLVHYSLARGDAAPADASPTTTPSASAGSTAAGSTVPPPAASTTPPASPTTTSTPPPATTVPPPPGSATTTTVTCWNGATTARKSQCSEPTGVAGLRWVFPTLDSPSLACHPASRATGDFRTVIGRECFARVGGKPVTITFEQVASTPEADQAIERSYAGGDLYTISGARGGRRTWFDPRGQPARVTGYYQGYPYVATLYADDPQTVKYAWAALVRFRDPAAVRGIRG